MGEPNTNSASMGRVFYGYESLPHTPVWTHHFQCEVKGEGMGVQSPGHVAAGGKSCSWVGVKRMK